MGPERLEEHTVTLERRAFELVECIGMRRDGHGVVDLSQFLHHFAYDVMVSDPIDSGSQLDQLTDQ